MKLADRIANVDYSLAKGGKDDMYRKEYPGFRAALYNKHQTNENYELYGPEAEESLQRMWSYLDRVIGS